MVISKNRRQLSLILLITAPLVTLTITPWVSYDAVNIPKLAILTVFAAITLALLVLDFRLILDSRFQIPVLAALIFKIDLFLVLVVNASPFNEHFFGTNGRNTGYLAYVALLILFLATVLNLDKNSSEKLLWCLLGTGILSALYGLLQSLGMDPFKWNNPYSPVIGFLGNPDFQSSILGICGVAAVALFFQGKSSLRIRGLLAAFLILSLYVISKTKAQQGFLVLLIGCAVVIYVFLLKTKRTKKFSAPYLILMVCSGLLITLGSLNKGPLAHYLYKASVTYRGDYWRAGWKMSLQHPFFGVGLDSYGDWYRASRTVAATLRRGPDTVSNAAHNVLLDLSSNGGFPLLVAYLIIVGLVLVSSIRTIRRGATFDAVHAGLFGAWVAYQAQSIISLNQLGLVVWGWVLSGALIAYEISTRSGEPEVRIPGAKGKKMKSTKVKPQSSSPAVSVAIFVGFVIGLGIGLPPFLADASFRHSLSSGNATTIEKALTRWPIDDIRLIQGSQLFMSSKLNPQALSLAQLAARRHPRSYFAWQAIYSNTSATAAEKSEALRQMKILDPHNPNLK